MVAFCIFLFISDEISLAKHQLQSPLGVPMISR
jgi:hypothetical protein